MGKETQRVADTKAQARNAAAELLGGQRPDID
jgi:hypothetical protein